jgi:hypothetical protein
MVFVGLFESERDLRDSEAAPERMTAAADIGRRVSIEVFEVGVDVRA